MLTSTMTVTFLGTSSGGGPSTSRNCSSLVADVLGDGSLWMVDCAEGTLRQFQLQPLYSADRSNPRLSQVKKIFITHMHADHVMGIVPILRNLLFPVPVGENADKLQALRKPHPAIEIYGPAGIRTFIRSILKMTFTRMSDNYVVHELLASADQATSCDPKVMHPNEVAGEDIFCSAGDGLWRVVAQGKGIFGPVVVDAGPIIHRDPCIGYVFRETAKPFHPSPSLLIHEAADAYIPQEIDPKSKRSYDAVKEKALARGHSLPEMAGAFARTIGAQKLVLNHLGGRFPLPNPNEGYRVKSIRSNVIAEIERQATEAWGMGTARAAWDFMRVAIPSTSPNMPQTATQDELVDHTIRHPASLAGHPTAYNTWETSDTATSPDPPSYATTASRSQYRVGEGRSTRYSRNAGGFRQHSSQRRGNFDNADPL
ncbi:Zinc phosphodiesterase ELAC protein 1 [Lentinula edodes]|uniref:Zinc phosphodiesterase ELAC protein 1 n=1 Tax=Lentinula edodes TaxID=5353 RepID=A0A1Q3E458_LENED|nr:Zinc phosphodiesterase ELAC protein 1 [Lentinula edodes]